MSTNLNALRRKEQYFEHDAPPWMRNIWPRPEAWAHFLKYNRDALAERGAIVKIGRDWFINSELFPTVAADLIGHPLGDSEGGSHD